MRPIRHTCWILLTALAWAGCGASPETRAAERAALLARAEQIQQRVDEALVSIRADADLVPGQREDLLERLHTAAFLAATVGRSKVEAGNLPEGERAVNSADLEVRRILREHAAAREEQAKLSATYESIGAEITTLQEGLVSATVLADDLHRRGRLQDDELETVLALIDSAGGWLDHAKRDLSSRRPARLLRGTITSARRDHGRALLRMGFKAEGRAVIKGEAVPELPAAAAAK